MDMPLSSKLMIVDTSAHAGLQRLDSENLPNGDCDFGLSLEKIDFLENLLLLVLAVVFLLFVSQLVAVLAVAVV